MSGLRRTTQLSRELRTILAFDYGLRQIGVATGQTLTRSSTPLEVIPAKNGQPQWDRVAALIEQWRPDALVVGLPLNMDGTESDMCALARGFASELETRFAVPVHLTDERLSSREARARGGTREDHDLAAKIIAETFLAED